MEQLTADFSQVGSVLLEAGPDAELMKLGTSLRTECLYGFTKSWNMTVYGTFVKQLNSSAVHRKLFFTMRDHLC